MRCLPVLGMGLGMGLLLAACARERAPDPRDEAPLSPAHAACRAEARNDPALQNVAQQLNATNLQNRERVAYDMRVAELRAYRDCLRRNGLAAPGGVEAPRPPR